jgi:hypothetical protein
MATPTGNHIVPRRLRGRMNPLRAGAIALAIITIATWLAFTKELPWHDPFRFDAVFRRRTTCASTLPSASPA